jgi:hypothetical protein
MRPAAITAQVDQIVADATEKAGEKKSRVSNAVVCLAAVWFL